MNRFKLKRNETKEITVRFGLLKGACSLCSKSKRVKLDESVPLLSTLRRRF